MDKGKRDHILNCDETGYALKPKGILTWSQVNVDYNSRHSLKNEKQQITVLATITADNTKLPLMFAAEGQTEKVEKTLLSDVDYHWTTHSDNGRITEESFIKYLMHINNTLIFIKFIVRRLFEDLLCLDLDPRIKDKHHLTIYRVF